MRRWKTTLLSVLTCCAMVALAGRAAWVASRLETGRTPLAIQVRDATLGWIAGAYVPVSKREPADQAEFWLRETERIVDANPESAQIAMGAALLLDTPGAGFSFRYVTVDPLMPGPPMPEVDRVALVRAYRQFHDKTDERCLALAARATELEPENRDWWRLRALLAFRGDFLTADRGPRSPGWQDLLDQCAEHDPENALYDYLAASYLWDHSGEINWEHLRPMPDIRSPAEFAQGVQRFEQGLGKTRCVVGPGVEFPLMLDVVCRSRLPRTERAETVSGRTLEYRLSSVLRELSRWQEARADECENSGDPEAAVRRLDEARHAVEQYFDRNDWAAVDLVSQAGRRASCAVLARLVDRRPGLVPESRRKKIHSERVSLGVEYRVLETASRTVAAQRPPPPRPVTALLAMVWSVTLSAAVLLLVLAALGWLAARWLGQAKLDEQPRLGAVRHLVALAAGFGLTFVVLGLAPAGVISPRAQSWIAATVVALAVLGVVVWVVWIGPRRRFQFGLRALFVVTFGMALLLGVLAWVGIDFSHLDELPARLSVPARGWDVCDAKVLEITVRGQFGTAGWAVYQWFAYSGFYVSLAASLVLVAWWQRVRLARAARDDQCRGWPAWRARWGATLRCVARSAAALALACTLVDFALTPGVLRLADASYQVQIAYARDPGATRASLRQEIDRIKADPETMQQIRAQVEQEIVREAEEDAAMEKAGLPEDDSDADGIMRFRSIPLSVKLTA